jgi:hypothetical protein
MPKKIAINCIIINFLSKVASGIDKPTVALCFVIGLEGEWKQLFEFMKGYPLCSLLPVGSISIRGGTTLEHLQKHVIKKKLH